ncbi:MAG: hypothetical protein RL701_5549, partial [Pseudomonadota bacterium]
MAATAHTFARTRCIPLLLTAALAWFGGCATGGSALGCRADPVTGVQQCLSGSERVGDAVVTTAVAAAVFAATGCAVNGCELPNTCNKLTKRCEPINCSETRECPSGYRCILSLQMC